MSGMHQAWFEEHQNYPHEAWCLVWPFARDTTTGRATASSPEGGTDWAHRIMCKMVRGPSPEGKPQVGHSCGNGHLGCVNPRHLSWVSNSENQILRYAQGRGNPNANGNKSRFTPEQIAEMQSLYGQMTQWEIATRFNCSLGLVQYYLKYRNERGHTGQKIKHWHPDEDQQLREGLAKGLRYEDIGLAIGRPPGACIARAGRLKIRSTRGPGGLPGPRDGSPQGGMFQ